ncbi:MAG TPA: hypothetical protein H9956_08750 [Candidatus Eisenbergiella pullicola]|nr:hypothetical protein [Candidatus Eisenbergiella pullicola]
MNTITISSQDKIILRDLAKKQYALSQTDANQKRIREWYAHNSLQGERPMIHLEMGSFEQGVIPARLKCEGEFARQVETTLYENFLNQELFDDDRVTPDYYAVSYDTYFALFQIPIHVHALKDSLGHEFPSIVEDLEADYHKLKKSSYGVNLQSTEERFRILQETFGDILPVRMSMPALYCVPTQMVVHFMKMENMMYNIYDYPELFLEMMNRIADDTLEYYRFLEEKHLIMPTVAGEPLGQGTWCYNHELPGPDEAAKRPFTTRDVWGFMDSQETVGMSPQMYQEFIFPCYQKISQQYGLLSYDCFLLGTL